MKIVNWKLIILITLVIITAVLWYFVHDKSAQSAQNKSENYPFINPELPKRYDDPDLNFFVDYSEGFVVNATAEESVKVLVFSKNNSDESFQIFIMPYDEPGPITPERILIDQPEMVIKNPQTIEIAGEETLVFFSTDPDLGDVREVWFVHPSTTLGASGHLYQASTYAKYDELLSKVMATFRFK